MHLAILSYMPHVYIIEYYYDIDFMDCAGQEEIQKRSKILYESYCDLV